MSIDNLDLSSYSFIIPELWKQDWEDAVQRAEGVEKNIIVTQARAANLLKGIKDKTVTPYMLAWMNIWAKIFSLLDSVYAAMYRNSSFTLDILNRTAIETFLHAHVISEPFKHSKSTKNYRRIIIDRLCAYTAWTLLEDKSLLWESLKKQNLDMIWSPAPTNRIRGNPSFLEIYEAMHGRLDLESGSSWLRVERNKHENQLHKERNRIDKWLQHPQLSEWVENIGLLTRNSGKTSVSFFAIFDEDERSIRKRFISLNMGFAYVIYKRTSMLIHGSSMDQFVHISDTHIAPKFFSTQDEAESAAKDVCSVCNTVILLLALMQKQLSCG
jgi:hypothetical protein